jgi:hypothetical protein
VQRGIDFTPAIVNALLSSKENLVRSERSVVAAPDQSSQPVFAAHRAPLRPARPVLTVGTEHVACPLQPIQEDL